MDGTLWRYPFAHSGCMFWDGHSPTSDTFIRQAFVIDLFMYGMWKILSVDRKEGWNYVIPVEEMLQEHFLCIVEHAQLDLWYFCRKSLSYVWLFVQVRTVKEVYTCHRDLYIVRANPSFSVKMREMDAGFVIWGLVIVLLLIMTLDMWVHIGWIILLCHVIYMHFCTWMI